MADNSASRLRSNYKWLSKWLFKLFKSCTLVQRFRAQKTEEKRKVRHVNLIRTFVKSGDTSVLKKHQLFFPSQFASGLVRT